MRGPLVYVVIADGGDHLGRRVVNALSGELAGDLGAAGLFDVALLGHEAAVGPVDRPADRIALLASPVDRLTRFLAGLVAARHLPVRARARRLATLVRRAAEVSAVPPERVIELERAALLFEVGRLVLDAREPSPEEVLRATRGALRGFPEFAPMAELIESTGENWDGTGTPGHREKGQIPYRSRLLRVAADYLRLLEQGVAARVAAEMLAERSGTHYDPRALAALGTVLERGEIEAATSDVRYVPLAELEPGMRLAEDVFSEGGVMLLAADSVLTANMLHALRARELTDPVAHGVAVRAAA